MITEEQAVEIARAEVERRGRPFLPEIAVSKGLLWYTVWTNAQTIGGSSCVRVGKRTGKVLSYWYVPR